MPGGPLFCYLAQMASKTLLSPCGGSISDIVGSFQSGGAHSGRRALTIECSLMSGCGQGYELVKDIKEAVAQVSKANSQQKWKYRRKRCD